MRALPPGHLREAPPNRGREGAVEQSVARRVGPGGLSPFATLWSAIFGRRKPVGRTPAAR
jgi:hypothetical protein